MEKRQTESNGKPVKGYNIRKHDDGIYTLKFMYDDSLIDFVHLEARIMVEDILVPSHKEADEAGTAFMHHYNALYANELVTA